MSRRVRQLLLVALAVAPACTPAYLYDERRDEVVPNDRTVQLEGAFCTPAPNEVVRPIKVLLAMDASQSMRVTDPEGTRARAVVELLDNLPQEKEIQFAVMLFAGSTTAWLTKDNVAHFERVIDYSAADKTQLRQRILNFAVPGNDADRDSTDFVKPLSDIYSLLNTDIGLSRLERLDAGAVEDETRARYSVIFLSDGQPTINQDRDLLCGDAVKRIRQLKDLADDVRLNTVHVFLPNQPIASTSCEFDGGVIIPPRGRNECAVIPTLPLGACPLLIVNQNAERLQSMATLGGGDFRDFRNNEPINFLNFRFGQVRRNFTFDALVASSFSSPAGSPMDQADTDSDGLLDADELVEGTLPWVVDTDGDGFSDGVEVFYRGRGGVFTPNQIARPDGGGLDPGCPPELRGVDSDCDGLLDCDEQLVGTNARRIDSDDDGVPDSVEFKLGTQASSPDLDQDPDNDHLVNRDEVSMHMNPLEVDSERLSEWAYRVTVDKDGGIDDDGRQCFSFRIANIALADTIEDTRDAGNPDGGPPLVRRGPGYNDLFLSLSMRPGDDPSGHTSMRVFRHTTSRYPIGGLRAPHDGRIVVTPDDFVPGCKVP